MVQPRKTQADITEKLLTGMLRIKSNKQIKNVNIRNKFNFDLLKNHKHIKSLAKSTWRPDVFMFP